MIFPLACLINVCNVYNLLADTVASGKHTRDVNENYGSCGLARDCNPLILKFEIPERGYGISEIQCAVLGL